MLSRPQLNTRYISRVTQGSRHYTSPAPRNGPILQLLQKYKDAEHDGYKLRAYAKAIQTISKLDYDIQSPHQVDKVVGIGKSIRNKIITEYLDKRPVDNRSNLEKAEALRRLAEKELQTIPGVGATYSKKLVNQGCMGLEDLNRERFQSMMTPHQRIEFRYMRHTKLPVKREDCEQVVAFVRDSLPDYEVVPMGGYRRGNPTSPEVQIMLLHPDWVHVPLPDIPPPTNQLKPIKKCDRRPVTVNEGGETNLLHVNVIPTLQERGLLAATLGLRHVSWWHGIIRLPGDLPGWDARSQRIQAIKKLEGDFRYMNLQIVSPKSRGAASLYLTGDFDFFRDLRLKAHGMGMCLNAEGLWKWVPEESQTSDEPESNRGHWRMIPSHTEEAIFSALGIPTIEPNRRNYGILGLSRVGRGRQPLQFEQV